MRNRNVLYYEQVQNIFIHSEVQLKTIKITNMNMSFKCQLFKMYYLKNIY